MYLTVLVILKMISVVVYEHDEEVDFLDAWAKMIERYGLQNNT